MDHLSYQSLKNNSLPVDLSEIPFLNYDDFTGQITELLKDTWRHCIAYYGIEDGSSLKLFCCIADDNNGNILVFGHETEKDKTVMKSLTASFPALHIFEREINENYGVIFEGHPWLKPLRYPEHRKDRSEVMESYPFYEIEGGEVHEVGVGPVHAGVIEPGHFRFICNGEKVLHLEIQLGYQHRGIEKLFIEKNGLLQRSILSESIAGDTAIGHGLAYAQLIESLAGTEIPEKLQIERCIALEMERLAVHIGDTAALCGDVAYQLGQSVCEALRTAIINTTQLWCGNRFGKGLIRPGGTNYPLTERTAAEMRRTVQETGRKFGEINDRIYSLPSLLARFDDIGKVTFNQAGIIGATGMAARSCGIPRDIRATHPFQYFRKRQVIPVMCETGDVLARAMLRSMEAKESVKIIDELVDKWQSVHDETKRPEYDLILEPGKFAVSMIEGWRGEICHTVFTDGHGKIVHYKVKDPSFHNWMALALAVRGQEISDFPVCNKSFNLSYCGNDL
jgi:Ni,Fe-hydrogenase III large subunit